MKVYSELKSLGFFEWLDNEHGVEEECVNCNEQKKVHSMCLDCCIKLGNQNQTEISDEEIEKEAKQTYREHPNNPKEFTDWSYGKDVNFVRKQKAFIKGAKWYREQLKQKK